MPALSVCVRVCAHMHRSTQKWTNIYIYIYIHIYIYTYIHAGGFVVTTMQTRLVMKPQKNESGRFRGISNCFEITCPPPRKGVGASRGGFGVGGRFRSNHDANTILLGNLRNMTSGMFRGVSMCFEVTRHPLPQKVSGQARRFRGRPGGFGANTICDGTDKILVLRGFGVFRGVSRSLATPPPEVSGCFEVFRGR